MIASHRGRVISSGFSTTTCLPACAARTAGSQVGAAGRADADDVEPGMGEHPVEVVVDPAVAPGQLGDLGAVGLRPAEGRHDAGPLDLVDRPRVELGDHAATDDAETVLGHGTRERRRGGQRERLDFGLFGSRGSRGWLVERFRL